MVCVFVLWNVSTILESSFYQLNGNHYFRDHEIASIRINYAISLLQEIRRP